MVALGMFILAVSAGGVFLWWRGTLFACKPALWVMTVGVLAPQVANQAGWFAAEIGRQPWIVYNELRTADALSKVVTANQVLASLILFMAIYALLFAVFVYLLDHKIRKGPDANDDVADGSLQQQLPRA